jgi:hypothetical protein
MLVGKTRGLNRIEILGLTMWHVKRLAVHILVNTAMYLLPYICYSLISVIFVLLTTFSDFVVLHRRFHEGECLHLIPCIR